MKFIYLVLCLLSSNCFAIIITADSTHQEDSKYANIYADMLIEQYDKRLDLISSKQDSILTDIYSKILASRDFIEHHGEFSEKNFYSILELTDSEKFGVIVNNINKRSFQIKKHIIIIQNKDNSYPVLYPSLGGSGNLTGNTFPRNVWSLTFDDGPHSSRTKQVVDNLYLHNMKATFFMLMKQVNVYPQALDYVLQNDMELALHSYNHLNLVKQTPETVMYEIVQAKKELELESNRIVKLFRLPYGSGTRSIELRKVIAAEKMLHIFWNVDTLDWKDKDPQSIFERTIKQMKLTPNQSGIILFHDIHAQTVVASEMIMYYLSEESKKVCLLDAIIKYHNGKEQDCL